MHAPRPINNVKMYVQSAAEWKRRNTPELAAPAIRREALARLWRNIFGGAASARFHRPPVIFGLGLNHIAQIHIKSLRMLTDATNVFACQPHNDLLSDRQPNEAYCLANLGHEYAVYFVDGGSVRLDLSAVKGDVRVQWLDIAESRWAKEETLEGGSTVALTPPGKGHWLVLIKGKMTTKSDRIRISPRNPRYFEYKQKPVFLTGGA